ncbi:hypothetical protein ITJ38_07600 [Agreia pratensis]|uniref:Uncharacterized protein n=1 Tax=Agreia pratensis TaxID=150121 RepID=A0A1X7K7X4_9MICO|nr:hypothetical protein [Agreia pratensis]MBF4634260.1 hypothetical protein [Agreia pratensis]SMG36936.1 hypothetical protein SAMN06296010_2210 [Agreia pratensis]
MTSVSDATASTEASTTSMLAAPDAPALRMVGASGAVCVDGVCIIEPGEQPSRQAAADPS